MSVVGLELPPTLAAAAIAAIAYCILAVICAIAEGKFGWKRPQWASVSLIAVALIVFVLLGAWMISIASAADYGSALPCSASTSRC